MAEKCRCYVEKWGFDAKMIKTAFACFCASAVFYLLTFLVFVYEYSAAVRVYVAVSCGFLMLGIFAILTSIEKQKAYVKCELIGDG